MNNEYIYFNLFNCINKEGLVSAITFNIAGRDTNKLDKVAKLHSKEINQIADYLLELYGGHIVDSHLFVSSYIPKAISDLGFTYEQLLSEDKIVIPKNGLGL